MWNWFCSLSVCCNPSCLSYCSFFLVFHSSKCCIVSSPIIIYANPTECANWKSACSHRHKYWKSKYSSLLFFFFARVVSISFRFSTRPWMRWILFIFWAANVMMSVWMGIEFAHFRFGWIGCFRGASDAYRLRARPRKRSSRAKRFSNANKRKKKYSQPAWKAYTPASKHIWHRTHITMYLPHNSAKLLRICYGIRLNKCLRCLSATIIIIMSARVVFIMRIFIGRRNQNVLA